MNKITNVSLWFEISSLFLNYPFVTFSFIFVKNFLKLAAHRKKSYPHTHTPIKAVRPATNMNRQASKDSNSTLTKIESPTETPISTAPNSPISESSNSGGYGNDTVSGPSGFSSYADYTSRNVSENIEEEEAQISERAAAEYNDDEVTFKKMIRKQVTY
jgi:hypothetical protein